MSGQASSSGAARDQRGLIDTAWAQVAEARLLHRGGNFSGGSSGFRPTRPIDDIPGYQVLDEIHRGGQGVVYRCLQESTGRTVALKIMIGGAFARPEERMRFAREIQILAELKHPNIVTIHDSGSAGNARFIVMDYVEGRPLDKYLRETNLPLESKLRLMARICAAVHSAHLRGIIHRDLKPGNIRIDASGEPHILDFGLAKFSNEDESALSDVTVTGQFVGSLPWASPEQARGRLDQMDLRTDVYSLGVLLYQVLTGGFPYQTTGGLDTIVKNIIHGEPADPRTRNREVPADLSAIVLKALRKEPDARYETAGSLGRDIERHLAGDVVEARRDSTWYVLRKHIRRHRGRAAISLLVLAFGAWTVGMLVVRYREEARLRARAQEALKEAQRQSHIAQAVNNFLNDDLLASASPENKGRKVTVHEVLDSAAAALENRFTDEPLVKAQIHRTLGNSYRGLSEYENARNQLEKSLKLLRENSGPSNTETIEVAMDLARVQEEDGKYKEAEDLCRESLDILEREKGQDDPLTIRTRGDLGWVMVRMDKLNEGESLIRQALLAAKSSKVRQDEAISSLTNELALVARQLNHMEEAESLQLQAVELSIRVNGPEHPETLTAMSNLADTYRGLKRYDEAERLCKDVLEKRRRVQGPGHLRTLNTLTVLGAIYANQQKNEEAAALFEEGVRAAQANLEKNHPTTVTMESNLGFLYDRLGRHAEAEKYHLQAAEGIKATMPAGHINIGIYVKRLGHCETELNKYAEAEPLLREAYPILEKSRGPTSTDAQECARDLAKCCDHLNKSSEAAEWRMKAGPESGS